MIFRFNSTIEQSNTIRTQLEHFVLLYVFENLVFSDPSYWDINFYPDPGFPVSVPGLPGSGRVSDPRVSGIRICRMYPGCDPDISLTVYEIVVYRDCLAYENAVYRDCYSYENVVYRDCLAYENVVYRDCLAYENVVYRDCLAYENVVYRDCLAYENVVYRDCLAYENVVYRDCLDVVYRDCLVYENCTEIA